ncbi:hypothetical protein BG004_007823, partial [Podila humilis]
SEEPRQNIGVDPDEETRRLQNDLIIAESELHRAMEDANSLRLKVERLEQSEANKTAVNSDLAFLLETKTKEKEIVEAEMKVSRLLANRTDAEVKVANRMGVIRAVQLSVAAKLLDFYHRQRQMTNIPALSNEMAQDQSFILMANTDLSAIRITVGQLSTQVSILKEGLDAELLAHAEAAAQLQAAIKERSALIKRHLRSAPDATPQASKPSAPYDLNASAPDSSTTKVIVATPTPTPVGAKSTNPTQGKKTIVPKPYTYTPRIPKTKARPTPNSQQAAPEFIPYTPSHPTTFTTTTTTTKSTLASNQSMAQAEEITSGSPSFNVASAIVISDETEPVVTEVNPSSDKENEPEVQIAGSKQGTGRVDHFGEKLGASDSSKSLQEGSRNSSQNVQHQEQGQEQGQGQAQDQEVSEHETTLELEEEAWTTQPSSLQVVDLTQTVSATRTTPTTAEARAAATGATPAATEATLIAAETTPSARGATPIATEATAIATEAPPTAAAIEKSSAQSQLTKVSLQIAPRPLSTGYGPEYGSPGRKLQIMDSLHTLSSPSFKAPTKGRPRKTLSHDPSPSKKLRAAIESLQSLPETTSLEETSLSSSIPFETSFLSRNRNSLSASPSKRPAPPVLLPHPDRMLAKWLIRNPTKEFMSSNSMTQWILEAVEIPMTKRMKESLEEDAQELSNGGGSLATRVGFVDNDGDANYNIEDEVVDID